MAGRYVLGSEPDDLVFRSGDLFPLGSAYGAPAPEVDGGTAAPAVAGSAAPYGLRHAAVVRPEEYAAPLDARALALCPRRQIALLDGEPLSAHAARTNGKTKVPYETDTVPKAKRDQGQDVRDD